jgi:WD40 repeat protein
MVTAGIAALALWASPPEAAAQAPKPIGVLDKHGGPVHAVAWSPDGKHALTGSEDQTAILWDLTKPKKPVPIKTLKDPGAVLAVAWSADGKWIATGCKDRTNFKNGYLWDVTQVAQPVFKHAFMHKGHAEVTSVAFSPDSKRILTAFRDEGVQLWDVITGKPLDRFTDKKNGMGLVISVAFLFSAGGDFVLAGSQDTKAYLWSTAGPVNTPHNRYMGHHSKEIRAVACSPANDTVLTGSADKLAILWKPAGGFIHKFVGHTDAVNAVAYSPPDGKFTLTGSNDKTARIWDTATRKELRSLSHPGAVHAVAFRRDGKLILTGCADKKAYLWTP